MFRSLMIILSFVMVGQAATTPPDLAILLPSDTPELSCFSDSLCYSHECHYKRQMKIVRPSLESFSSGLEAVVSCGNIKAYFKCSDMLEYPGEGRIWSFCYTYERVDRKGKLQQFYALQVSIDYPYSAEPIECRTDSGKCSKYRRNNDDFGFILGMPSSCYSQTISDSGLALPSAFQKMACNCSGAPCIFTRELQVTMKNDTYGSSTEVIFECFDVKVSMTCPRDVNECINFRQCYKYANGNSSFGVIEMVVPKEKHYRAPVCQYEKGNCPVFYDTLSETKYVISLRGDCTGDDTTV